MVYRQYAQCAHQNRMASYCPVGGRTLARQAALAAGGRLAIPDFGLERPAGASDFNDLHRTRGLAAVLTVVGAATAPSAGGIEGDGEAPIVAPDSEWPEPEPLTEPLDPLPYPVDALPPMLRDAVREAQAFVQAPIALVACSALAVATLNLLALVYAELHVASSSGEFKASACPRPRVDQVAAVSVRRAAVITVSLACFPGRGHLIVVMRNNSRDK